MCFSPRHEFLDFDPAVLGAARASYERGAIVYAHCSASFILGEAGLLESRRAIDPPLAWPEMGWALAPAAHGKGYAAEALAAMSARVQKHG